MNTNDRSLIKKLKSLNISLTIDEVEKIEKATGREPTIVELYIFNAEWSEHCSYKSSRKALKALPTDAPRVVLGPRKRCWNCKAIFSILPCKCCCF